MLAKAWVEVELNEPCVVVVSRRGFGVTRDRTRRKAHRIPPRRGVRGAVRLKRLGPGRGARRRHAFQLANATVDEAPDFARRSLGRAEEVSAGTRELGFECESQVRGKRDLDRNGSRGIVSFASPAGRRIPQMPATSNRFLGEQVDLEPVRHDRSQAPYQLCCRSEARRAGDGAAGVTRRPVAEVPVGERNRAPR